jgi:hypothetical protein
LAGAVERGVAVGVEARAVEVAVGVDEHSLTIGTQRLCQTSVIECQT